MQASKIGSVLSSPGSHVSRARGSPALPAEMFARPSAAGRCLGSAPQGRAPGSSVGEANVLLQAPCPSVRSWQEGSRPCAVLKMSLGCPSATGMELLVPLAPSLALSPAQPPGVTSCAWHKPPRWVAQPRGCLHSSAFLSVGGSFQSLPTPEPSSGLVPVEQEATGCKGSVQISVR